jgi:4-amino-4-deoxy-L-arabinose transferase-like glycosyltransferase
MYSLPMRFRLGSPGQMPFSTTLVVLMCLIYALAGITSHDPWKNADAIHLGIAYDYALRFAGSLRWDSQWLIPTLAGEPHLTSPPLFHWLAAISGSLFDPWLAWHNGARLVSAIFTLLGLFLISLAARGFHGRDASLIAPLLAIGSLGLLVPAHDAQPALIEFASIAGVMAALAWWEMAPRRSAIGLAFAVGLGFLGSGLTSLVLSLSALLLALCFRHWRRVSRSSWLIFLSLSLLLVLSWPFMLYEHSPSTALRWLHTDWSSMTSIPNTSVKRLELLLWGTWPVLPFSAWTVWLNRHRLSLGRHALPLCLSVMALVLFMIADDGDKALLAVIAAMAVMGSAESGRLRRGAANAFDWFSAITLSLFMGLVTLAGVAIMTGEPARIAKNFIRPAVGFEPNYSWVVLALSTTVILLWGYLLYALPRSPWRASTRWATGVLSLFVLLVCVLAPWVDHTKSYRSVAHGITQATSPADSCIERSGLGAAQRASLFYFAEIKTVAISDQSTCRYRIVQTGAGKPPLIDGWKWHRDFSRPGDRKERLRLYLRHP